MAVKCNIPELAIQQIQRMLYGFNCIDITFKIAENYREYLNCPFVDYQNCRDFPCVAPEGSVTCDISGVNLAVNGVTSTSATITFVPPSQSYIVAVINQATGVIIYSVANPISPINITGLINNTDYVVRLTMNCPGGESKQVEVSFHTLPFCVTITDFVGIPEITP